MTNRMFKRPDVFVSWDMFSIVKCDILFAYLERGYKENASNLGAEIGYAAAKSKLIILVTEKETHSHELIETLASVVFKSLEEGIRFLNSLKSADVYLAGSLQSHWQHKLIGCKKHNYLNPADKEGSV